jgi:hypothetical protein
MTEIIKTFISLPKDENENIHNNANEILSKIRMNEIG